MPRSRGLLPGAAAALIAVTLAMSSTTGSVVIPGASVSVASSAVRIAVALKDLADELRPPSYRLPVAGPVLRPFERPEGPYGPGHRGVDLAAPVGSAVRAAERGAIFHAGPVAGVVWVSIDHADGVRTSYGPLMALQVRSGDHVERGEIIGLLADGGHGDPEHDQGLHLGARRDGEYIDPMRLPGIGLARPTLVAEGGWWGAAPAVSPYAPWRGGRLGGLLVDASPVATAPGFGVAPNPNHLMLVAGLASSSSVEILDPEHLGIGSASVTRVSYVGPDVEYGIEDTWRGVADAARALEAQLRSQARSQPGRAVDLVGHSLGGVVIAYYLLHLHDPWDVGLPPIGHVVTIASPLEGSDLARAGVALVDSPFVGDLSRGAWYLAGSLPGIAGATARSLEPDAPVLRDIATSSALLDSVARGWEDARSAPLEGPLASGTRILNVVATLDGLVSADRAALPGTERRVLPGTHEGVLATEAVREVVWRFLAGQDVVHSPGHLATHVGAWYGTALTAAAVLAGDRGAVADLPSPLLPLSPLATAR